MQMPDPLLRALDVTPRHAYPFLWADYVELLCLCSRNGWVSRGNVQAQTQEAQDLQVDEEGNEADDAAQLDTDEAAKQFPMELDDKVSARWADIRTRLQAREVSWAGWPFRLEGSMLHSRFDAADPEHRLYVALLMASSLRLCHNTRSGEVSNAFEEISYHWLRRSLNNLWEVRPFGAHQTLPMCYKGTLRIKLEALAVDLKATLMKQASDYDPQDTGDGGIDLVAWMRMGDRRGNWPVIFGQCACSPTDWESKQLSVTGPAVGAHLIPQTDGAAYCFVPHDLHASDTDWQRASHVARTVLVDRSRILHLFRDTKAWGDLPHWSFVDEPAALRAAMAA